MLRSFQTWSGPGGWIKVLVTYVRGQHHQRPSRVWFLLAVTSMLPFIALPLSGFTLELTDGQKPGDHPSDRALLSGHNASTFPSQDLDYRERIFNRWRYAVPAQLRGQSAFYVPEERAETGTPWLQTFPNVWPDDDSADVFLAPQSNATVTGETWGLQSIYNCKVIDAVDEFQMLSQRTPDGARPRCLSANWFAAHGYTDPVASDACDYDVYIQEPQPNNDDATSRNLFSSEGSLELAVRTPDLSGGPAESMLLEALLWQSPIEFEERCPSLKTYSMKEVLSNDLGITVNGISRDHRPSEYVSFKDNTTVRLDAIGVQCNSSLTIGTATVNGLSGIYNSFKAMGPKLKRFSWIPHHMVVVSMILRSESVAAHEAQWGEIQKYLNQSVLNPPTKNRSPIREIASNNTWLTNLFRSVDAFNPVKMECNGSSYILVSQTRPLDSTQFQQALIRVLKAYAIEVTTSRGPQWYGDLVYARPTVIIVTGKLNPLIIVILLVIWAVLCSGLGIVYSTRPRWSDMLDGFSMFRFGSDVPGFADGICCVENYEHCSDLLDIPGMVGDSQPTLHPGHISLVKDTVARRDKKYQGSAHLRLPVKLSKEE